MDFRDGDRLISQLQADLRNVDASCRRIDSMLAHDRATILSESWMNTMYPLPRTDSRPYNSWPDTGAAPTWQNPSGSAGSSFEGSNVKLGFILSVLYFVFYFLRPEILARLLVQLGLASPTDRYGLGCVAAISLVLLGPPIGIVIWPVVVALVRWVLAKVVFAPISVMVKASKTPSRETSEEEGCFAQDAPMATQYYLEPYPALASTGGAIAPTPPPSPSFPPSPPLSSSSTAIPPVAIADTQPLSTHHSSKSPSTPVAARIEGRWRLRWDSANQPNYQATMLLIGQVGNKFRGILFRDGQMSIKMQGKITGNVGEFIYWPYQLEAHDRAQQTKRGRGRFDVLNNNSEIKGSWRLGTGATMTFRAIKVASLLDS